MSAAPRRWRTSSFSGGGGNACVELAITRHEAGVRDTKSRQTELIFNRAAFTTFLRAVRLTGR
ncbi:DUF397 domain-containing protein [Actinokineospora enzanensis]|uniref:DUF397 domain-containing protein n=1 Tax=Actinokineospora enzanensis TaxID=155975 RepID=UPI000A038B6D|nr:DUF397 domain-containing protein [Actinokineospora enzanensis]